MFLQISPTTIDDWLKDEEAFCYDFLRAQHFIVQSVGYAINPSSKALKEAHRAWKARCDEWLNGKMADPGKPLSLMKVLAILLYELCEAQWIRSLEEFDEEKAPAPFAGTDDEKQEVRNDIAAGREAYLALQFVVVLINWFEKARTDRIQEFEFRMTLDLSHDIMFYLTGAQKEPIAIYLILKALYTRDPTPDAPNN
ncbi:hypothetical protein [Reyranella massiliensis]|uniref:hypothetical protein n=1 Tax=Reyranella massiliensis TaxID=445220 RepID=UPI00031DEF87|nr:hypothetical protein [Reyranella massiliensis]